jgi:hypothetical protein
VIICKNFHPNGGERVAEVIELKDLIKKKIDSESVEKIASVKKILQCTMCMLKCTKCGTQTDVSEPSSDELPFRLCPDCKEEYQEYRARLTGNETSSRYWHNREWMAVWDAWIRYQESLKRYTESKEFLMLLEELQDL